MAAEVKKEIRAGDRACLVHRHCRLLEAVRSMSSERLSSDSTEIVHGTEQFRTRKRRGACARCRQAMAWRWFFINSPEAPVECAVEISSALKEASGTSAAHGHSQRTGQRRDRCERTSEHCWGRHQYRTAGHGLRRCRTHSCCRSMSPKISKNTLTGSRICMNLANAK